jgi:phenylalanyl-tRNA synthetase beta chain
MKISINWLNQYVNINIPVDEFVIKLQEIGFDIESVEKQADLYNNFVIGKVLEKSKHPNADKLSLCTVDIGTEVFKVVCGAPNVDKDQTICFAKLGAVIPNSGFELKKAKIRGELSEGMICSAKELNLGEDHAGIMILDDKLPLGSPFSEYIGKNDVIIDLSITPNRGDLLSHIGVANEAAFILNQQLKIPEINFETDKSDKIENYIDVIIEDKEQCKRYCGMFIKNVKVQDSPEWLKDYLLAVGLRPINNIVDATNYVMMECGQPLHAFDYRQINGKKIIVKDAGSLLKYTTLDSKERKLREDILMICDAEKPVGIAGIMGGENSEIINDTTEVFLESAFFDPVSIRISSKFIGLQTDSSYRFERGVAVDTVEWACKRASKLIAELSGGQIVEGFIDNYPATIDKKIVELSLNNLNKISGLSFDMETAKSLLTKIGIACESITDDSAKFSIPYSRSFDLDKDIDLIEEVVRMSGYNNIPLSDNDNIKLDVRNFHNSSYDFVNGLKNYISGRGYKEIISNTLLDENLVKLFEENYIPLINPSTIDMNVLRSNLMVGALQTVKYNFNFKAASLKLFEIGNVFKFNDKNKGYFDNIAENRHLLITIAGNYDLASLNQKSRLFDIFDLKGEVKVLLEKLNIANYKLNYYNYVNLNPNLIEFVLSNNIIARVFDFSAEILNSFDLKIPVICCEIDVDKLKVAAKLSNEYKEISKYPPVLRDLSVVVDTKVKVSELEKIIYSESGNLLKNVNLYDKYNIIENGIDKISYTYSLEYASNEKTLTDDEINKIQEKIIKNLQNKLKASLRK